MAAHPTRARSCPSSLVLVQGQAKYPEALRDVVATAPERILRMREKPESSARRRVELCYSLVGLFQFPRKISRKEEPDAARMPERLGRSEEHTSELQSHSDLVC